MKIRTATGEFVEYGTEEERKAAIIDRLEAKEKELGDRVDTQFLNKEEFFRYMDEIRRRANLPHEQEQDAVVQDEMLTTNPPKAKAKTPIEPNPAAPKEDG